MLLQKNSVRYCFGFIAVFLMLCTLASSICATQIAGTITAAGGSPLAGVSIVASDAGGSTTSGSDGKYALTITSGWSGVVSVLKTGYVFTPGARKYVSVTTDKLVQDYTASALPTDGLFTQVTTNFPAISYSATPWGDYDGDGKLDVMMAGDAGTSATINCIAKLMHNDGSAFSEVTTGIASVTNAAAAWSDYDGDGKLDLALSGWNSSDSCTVYHNGGAGSFTNINAGLPGNYAQSLSWVDYNNDGRPDLICNGWNGFSIYRNDGSGVFSSAPAQYVSRAKEGTMVWADYDNDGDMDALIMGITNNDQYGQAVPVTKLYRNDNGVFLDSGVVFPQLLRCSAAWGDYDADGNLDLAISGATSWSYRYSYIYRGDGLGNFTDIAAPLVTVDHSSLAWADYDNDGDLDLGICGFNGTTAVTKIYRNDNGAFVDTLEPLAGVMDGSLTWADYNGDGKLDLLVTGGTRNNVNDPGRIVRLYSNKCPVANTAPTAPTSPSARVLGQDIVFSWVAATDTQGMAGGLSYNIRVGTAVDKQDIVPSCSNISTGQRLIPALGNAQKKLTYTIKGLAAGVPFLWSVQSIDSSMAGSQWATNQTFTMIKISGTVTKADGTPVYNVKMAANNGGGFGTTDKNGYYEVCVLSNWSGKISPTKTDYTFSPPNKLYSAVTTKKTAQDYTAIPPRWESISAGVGLFGGALAWADFDNDGRLDLGATGGTTADWGIDNPFGPAVKVNRNIDNSGEFAEAYSDSPGYTYASLACGDINGDGRMDLAVNGFRGTGGWPTTNVLRNTGASFDSGINLSPGLARGSLSWADYNNDGTMDLLATGIYFNGSTFPGYTDIYANDRIAGTLTATGSGIPAFGEGSTGAWADYDNDGDMDVVICGNATFNQRTMQLFRNDNGIFTATSAQFVGMSASRLVCGDYNNDGRFDLFVTGEAVVNGSLVNTTKIYRNDGNNVFTDILATLAAPVAPSIALGDYDNDGRLDFIIAGSVNYSSPAVGVIKLYHNDGGDVFTEFSTTIKPANRPSIAWGDFDNDGSLDLAVTGIEDDGTIVTKIYKNNNYLDAKPTNTPPSAPTGLSIVKNNTNVTFKWQASSDAQTPAAGLCYNLRVGTTPGGNEIMASQANSTGWRKLPALGNAQKMLSWTLKNLSAGQTYYWSVQAIDTSYAASAWAPEQIVQPISSKSVSQLKMLADGEQVRIDAAIVSMPFANYFYIESDNRCAGIRVEKTAHGLTVGKRADILGTMRTNSDGERYIEADSPKINGVGWVQPVAMTVRSIGGSNWKYTQAGAGGQVGVKGSSGLNTTGLLVCALGWVTYSTSGYFYIDDGSGIKDDSGHVGIKVITNGFASPDQDTFQKVTGVSSCFKTGANIYPALRIHAVGDVVEIQTW